MLAYLYRRDDRDVDILFILLISLSGINKRDNCAIGLLSPYILLGLSAPGN